jgi:MinD-like ATPase involved in chromosome partitioning or flagellar assembly
MSIAGARLCVLLLAGGAPWEAEALVALGEAGVVVVKRCVDVPDLMASAVSSGATVAVVEGSLPHLDAEAVMHLLRYDVRVLGIGDPVLAERLGRLGVVETTQPVASTIVEAVRRVAARDVVADPETDPHRGEPAQEARNGRIVAVWGPAGAPGRTTVAVSLAAELATTRPTVLVDADPYGGTVAQALGVLDEASGLLAVARMANVGTLDQGAFARACRRVGERLDVLTGLPRADRRVEVRPGVLDPVLRVAAERGEVIVDCGFCIEDVESVRDRMTVDALGAADEVVVVGSAEPVGLSRLARGLVELQEIAGGLPVRVVVNRMRATLGWRESDIVGMIEGYVRPVAVHFLPEDRPTLDRSTVTGRSLREVGDSPLRAAVAELASAMWPTVTAVHAGRGRRRGFRGPPRRRAVVR